MSRNQFHTLLIAAAYALFATASQGRMLSADGNGLFPSGLVPSPAVHHENVMSGSVSWLLNSLYYSADCSATSPASFVDGTVTNMCLISPDDPGKSFYYSCDGTSYSATTYDGNDCSPMHVINTVTGNYQCEPYSQSGSLLASSQMSCQQSSTASLPSVYIVDGNSFSTSCADYFDFSSVLNRACAAYPDQSSVYSVYYDYPYSYSYSNSDCSGNYTAASYIGVNSTCGLSGTYGYNQVYFRRTLADTVAASSARPTLAPSHSPTHSPTFSRGPTTPPTALPTLEPTTHSPTLNPTPLPTLDPSAYPTSRPTARPTVRPTNKPSPEPSPLPSQLPSQVPTVVPTEVPTQSPSQLPSQVPTVVPTEIPTQGPSQLPSQVPTVVPTEVPTQSPSQLPSQVPTVAPTVEPTPVPSQLPTFVPSWNPSMQPSVLPTAVPSESPSAFPSIHPSFAPVILPTHAPVVHPTEAPVIAILPTHAPLAVVPTHRPTTHKPTNPPAPTRTPSFRPTYTVTVVPSGTDCTITVTFSVIQIVYDVDIGNYEVEIDIDIYVLQITIAQVLQIDVLYITIQWCTTSDTDMLTDGRKLETGSANVGYTISLPDVQSMGYATGMDAYNDLTSKLTAALNDNSFSEKLQANAAQYNAQALTSAGSDSAQYSDPDITEVPIDDDSQDSIVLSDGALAGVAVGCGVLVVALVVVGVYLFWKRKTVGMSKQENVSVDHSMAMEMSAPKPGTDKLPASACPDENSHVVSNPLASMANQTSST